MPRRPGGVRPPVRLEREYQALLRRLILIPLFADLEQRAAGATSAGEVDRAVESAFEAAEQRGFPPESIRDQLMKLPVYHRARLLSAFMSALGVDVAPILSEPAVSAFMQDVVSRNVDLIKTIPRRFHDSMKARLATELREAPFDRARLTDLIAKEYGSTGYNLRRLARDQTTKTIGGLTEIRHKQLGIQGYRWSTSGDERVRPTHAEKNGKMFRWDSPPADTGAPGQDIQCRCVAVPAITKRDRDRLGAAQTTVSPFPPAGKTRRGMLKRDEKRLNKASAEYIDGLPEEQRRALNAHTRGPDRMNISLRSGQKPPAEIERDIAHVKKAIADNPVPPPPLVYRGIGSRAGIGNPKPGDVVTLDGFASTSLDPDLAATFGFDVLEIRPKTGVYVKPVSGYKDENEWLMDEGKRYRVVGTDEARISGGTDRRKRPILQLEEIDDA